MVILPQIFFSDSVKITKKNLSGVPPGFLRKFFREMDFFRDFVCYSFRGFRNFRKILSGIFSVIFREIFYGIYSFTFPRAPSGNTSVFSGNFSWDFFGSSYKVSFKNPLSIHSIHIVRIPYGILMESSPRTSREHFRKTVHRNILYSLSIVKWYFYGFIRDLFLVFK